MAGHKTQTTELIGPVVMTVLGPISADRLGRVLVHEHLRIALPGEEFDPRSRQSRRSVERLCELKEHGLGTFVDPCPMDLGRDVELMAEVSERSGVNIVCATGFYYETDAIGLPYYWRCRWPEEIAELYISEIEQGVGTTGIRPGIVKAATGLEIGRHERKALIGAAIAAKTTGRAIVTHTTGSRCGSDQQDIFAENGADLSRCLIGHQDEVKAFSILEAIAKRGSFVGIDRVGFHKIISDEHRAAMVMQLVKAGHADHVCLSQDRVCAGAAGRPGLWISKERAAVVKRDILPKIDADTFGRSSSFIFTHFVPRLRELGLDKDAIDNIFIRNPRRLLVGAEA